jgi:NAD(P)-dependent dehydrogenase (short-subunit alcohol dehydrogenase family)
VIAINLDGVFLGTKHALRAMQHREPPRGSIINVSSIMAWWHCPTSPLTTLQRAALGSIPSRSRFPCA